MDIEDLKKRRRLDRQFAYMEHHFPRFAGVIRRLRSRPWVLVRLPLGLLMILGGFLAILPVFGLWMIPVGLLLLAVDIPFLRGPTGAGIVRGRRWLESRRRRWRP